MNEKQVRSALKISTLAILAGMLTTMPAAALDVNLGDGSGGLLNVNGSGGDNSTVNLDTGTGNLLGGSDGTDAIANVDLGGAPEATVDLGATNGSGPDATVDLGGVGGAGDGTLLDLFGPGSTDPTTANINLGNVGGTGSTNGNVLIDLFGGGSGSGQTAAVTLGSGDADGNVLIDLFGPGTGSDGSGGSAGSTGGGSGSATGGGSVSTGGTGLGVRTNSAVGVKVASLDANAGACFTPNAEQVAKLVNRHAYADSIFATWNGIASIKVVNVGVCDSAAGSITGNANIGRLQSFVNSRPALRDSLGKLGHTPSDVIGIDKNGRTLTVYVL